MCPHDAPSFKINKKMVPVYLVDFACFKPDEEDKVDVEKASSSSTQTSLDFRPIMQSLINPQILM